MLFQQLTLMELLTHLSRTKQVNIMILNPYYFVFYRIYKWLKKIGVIEEGVLFSAYAVLFLIFIPHLIAFLLVLKNLGIISGADLGMSKHAFGVSFALSFWLINHLLFGWRNRYIRVIRCYEKASKTMKTLNLFVLLLYFAFPFILMIT